MQKIVLKHFFKPEKGKTHQKKIIMKKTSKARQFIILMGALSICVCSCNVDKNIVYFQDATEVNGHIVAVANDMELRPMDKISIIVNCTQLETTARFNLPYVSQRLGQTTTSSITGTGQSYISGYTVDYEGNIDFPVLGKIHVAGLTRTEIAKLIRQKIVDTGQDTQPVVTVEFMNLCISVMGEVARPGRINIDRDVYTILDAISAAGDLTINGRRDQVLVLRNERGTEKTYTIDLTSAENVLNSPVYYLQQNDIVYIAPNSMRSRQSTINGNNVLSTSFWISLATLAITIINAIRK